MATNPFTDELMRAIFAPPARDTHQDEKKNMIEDKNVVNFMEKMLKTFQTQPKDEIQAPRESKQAREARREEKDYQDAMKNFRYIRNTMEVTPIRARRDNFSRLFDEMFNQGTVSGFDFVPMYPGGMAQTQPAVPFGTMPTSLPGTVPAGPPGGPPPVPQPQQRRLNLMNFFSQLGFGTMPIMPLEDVKTPLRKDVLSSLPLKEYKEIKATAKHTDCAICRCDFEDADKVNILQCQHLFHVDCITPWLKDHSHICPICRASCGGYEVRS